MKKYINQIFQISLFAAVIILASCESKQAIKEKEKVNHDSHGLIELSQQQVDQAKIKTGTFTNSTFGKHVEANGTLELPPNNLASISVAMEGFVEEIRFLEGAEVKKGQTLVVLKHPSYIQLQQDYLQATSRLSFLEQELARQKTLAQAKVNAEKTLQQTQSEYNQTKAEVSALKEKLRFLGISSDKVLKGTIQPKVYLPAPFSGTVTRLNAHKGQLVSPKDVIMEVIDREHMHLELQVFQRDVPKVKEGQKIKFTVPAFENENSYEGEVSLVGKNLDLQTKTIRVHGHFEESDYLIPGLYVEAQILTESRMRRALPESAVIRDQGKYYYFVQSEKTKDQVLYDKVQIQVGITNEGLTEVMNIAESSDTTKIVIEGAFYLKSEMNKEEGGHGD